MYSPRTRTSGNLSARIRQLALRKFNRRDQDAVRFTNQPTKRQEQAGRLTKQPTRRHDEESFSIPLSRPSTFLFASGHRSRAWPRGNAGNRNHHRGSGNLPDSTSSDILSARTAQAETNWSG